MKKIEYNEALRKLYTSTKKEPFFVDVPAMNYLCFDGTGHPSDEDFQVSCEALYTLSYLVKFEISRKELGIDYKVNPMEVTWDLDKSQAGTRFSWTMMIMQPDHITREHFEKAIALAESKGKNIASERVRFGTVDFGKCVQCFHLGDYNNMNATLNKMKLFAGNNGFESDQYTHDIYLNDMRKTKVENYKTIMRIKVYKEHHDAGAESRFCSLKMQGAGLAEGAGN